MEGSFLACLSALLRWVNWLQENGDRVGGEGDGKGKLGNKRVKERWKMERKFGAWVWTAVETESVKKSRKRRRGSVADWGEKARGETEGVTLLGCHSSLHSLAELCLWSPLSPAARFTGRAERKHTHIQTCICKPTAHTLMLTYIFKKHTNLLRRMQSQITHTNHSSSPHLII